MMPGIAAKTPTRTAVVGSLRPHRAEPSAAVGPVKPGGPPFAWIGRAVSNRKRSVAPASGFPGDPAGWSNVRAAGRAGVDRGRREFPGRLDQWPGRGHRFPVRPKPLGWIWLVNRSENRRISAAPPFFSRNDDALIFKEIKYFTTSRDHGTLPAMGSTHCCAIASLPLRDHGTLLAMGSTHPMEGPRSVFHRGVVPGALRRDWFGDTVAGLPAQRMDDGDEDAR